MRARIESRQFVIKVDYRVGLECFGGNERHDTYVNSDVEDKAAMGYS